MDPLATHRVDIAADHPGFAGHFPGRPILPGVALLAEVLEAASREPVLAAAIGGSPQLSVVKFLAPVLPGAALEIAFQLGERAIGFSVSDRGRVAATGQLVHAGRIAGPAP
jgi:3-hydroxyacyl-[acyl-carrier-protein] dehydratase